MNHRPRRRGVEEQTRFKRSEKSICYLRATVNKAISASSQELHAHVSIQRPLLQTHFWLSDDAASAKGCFPIGSFLLLGIYYPGVIGSWRPFRI